MYISSYVKDQEVWGERAQLTLISLLNTLWNVSKGIGTCNTMCQCNTQHHCVLMVILVRNREVKKSCPMLRGSSIHAHFQSNVGKKKKFLPLQQSENIFIRFSGAMVDFEVLVLSCDAPLPKSCLNKTVQQEK